MFETVTFGEEVSKRDFEQAEPQLHSQLLALQRRLANAGAPVIIVVAGVEGAGKGEVVNLLLKWFDARGVETHAFWEETDEERQRPRYWRFWRSLPARGRIGIVFGSWYTQPIIARVAGDSTRADLDAETRRINEFERAQCDDGALIVKLWFHLSKKEQRRRIKREQKGKQENVSPLTKKYAKLYDEFSRVCERAIRLTDHSDARWHLIGSDHRPHRDLAVARTLIAELQRFLSRQMRPAESAQPTAADTRGAMPSHEAPPGGAPTAASNEPSNISPRDDILAPSPRLYTRALATVDLSATISPDDYRRRLAELQHEIFNLAWRAHAEGVNMVAVFEGWDAAGKGGAIRRLTQAMDARLYQVRCFAAPTDEERAHHYLWRFWRHLPRAGYSTIYDRSWYGRVLVERVERLARPEQWGSAYQEINGFEEQLVEHGAVLLKFWLHIDRDEQFRRFKERETTPWKQHKITDEDWRNRERWNDYEEAVEEMIARTSSEFAPWMLVPANDKRYARIRVLEVVRDALARALSQ